MKDPARLDDEDARKLAVAPENSPRYLQRIDGSWSLIDDEGWEVEVDPEIVDDPNSGGRASGRRIFVAPQPLCDFADVQLAHELSQQHRACRIHQCVWKAAAQHTLLLTGRLVPQSMSPRERAAVRGIDYPPTPRGDAPRHGGPTPRTLREVLDRLESLAHDPGDARTR
ncbi:hypothetical protein [Nocardia sp. NPDC052112]|uniref:hypothetical protein n=1 Tax=Nocardia sp. NPDC052112 TaxID=3155646 RepID=UPI003436E317